MEDQSKRYNPQLVESLLEKEAEEELVLKTEPKQIFHDESLTKHILWFPPNVKNVEERHWVNLIFYYFLEKLNAILALIGYWCNYRNNSENSTTLQSKKQNDSLRQRLPAGISTTNEKNNHFESRLSLRLARDGLQRDSKDEEKVNEPEITLDSEFNFASRHDENDFFWRHFKGFNTSSGVIISISIRQVTFDSHPIMIKEEKLATRLQCLYYQYRDTSKQLQHNETLQKIKHSFKQISNLEREHSNSADSNCSAEVKKNVASLVKDITNLIVQIAQDEQQLSNMYIMILQVWGELLLERENKDFKSTSVTLSKVKGSEEVIDGVAEFLEPRMDQCDASSIFQKILRVIKTSRKRRYELRLLNTGESTKKLVTDRPMQASEKRRRRRLKGESYFARLIVNGRILGQTRVAQMNRSSFTAVFGSKFYSLLPHEVTHVSIKLYRRQMKGVLPNHHIATIYAKVDTDATQWYCFNGSGDQLKGYIVLSTHIESTSEPVSSDCMCFPMDKQSPFGSKQGRLIQSAPNTLIVANQKTTSLPFDTDTMTPSVRASIAPHAMTFKLRGTRTSFLNYFMVQESTRHLLMKDRCMKLTKYHDMIQLDEYQAFKETEHIAIGNEKGPMDIEVTSEKYHLKQIDFYFLKQNTFLYTFSIYFAL